MSEIGKHDGYTINQIGVDLQRKLFEDMHMSKSNYVEKIAQDNRPRGLSKKVIQSMVNDTFAFILKSLKEDQKFTYAGFGTFRVKDRKAKQGTNPNTGEKLTIAPCKAVSFKVSGKFKKKLR